MPVRRAQVAVLTSLARALVNPLAAVARKAPPSLPNPKVKAVVVGRSIAGVSIGMPLAKAKAAWGPNGLCAHSGVKVHCVYYDNAHARTSPGMTFTTDTSLRIQGVSVSAGFDRRGRAVVKGVTQFKTARGIHIGSTAEAVKDAYPTINTDYPKLGFELEGTPADTTFGLDNGKVYRISLSRHV